VLEDFLKYLWPSGWSPLSPFARLFVFLLVLVAVYTLSYAALTLVRLRCLTTLQNNDSRRKSLALLNHRSANMQQITLATFYLFGLTFFLQIQGAFWTPENRRPVSLMVLENFVFYFRFAAIIFLIFFVLHTIQWFVSGRIRAAEIRLRLTE